MAAWRYEISLLLSKKYFTRSLRSLEEKFRISARPCNILYISFEASQMQWRNHLIQPEFPVLYQATRS